ncbi:hypothetical protein C8J57DRAFT_950589, partial [Mycena rebaudengoi]
ESQMQQDIVWSRFCALYLPATVGRLLTDLPKELASDLSVNNPWHEMLVAVQHTPYFSKYLRTSSPIAASRKKLPRVLVERLTAVASRWDTKM